MTDHKTTNLSDAIRNLIVCDTQFGWNGETTLKLSELLDLQARGWLIEGNENNEFSLTVEGEAVIARALRKARPAELAEQQGVDMADADSVALEIARRFIPVDSPGAHNEGQQRAALQVAIVGAINAALAARQPEAQGTRQDHLLDRRNRLMNSYGNGDREDAAIDVQIAQVDAELALIDQRTAAPGVGNG